jgi:hypothetical protein
MESSSPLLAHYTHLHGHVAFREGALLWPQPFDGCREQTCKEPRRRERRRRGASVAERTKVRHRHLGCSGKLHAVIKRERER